MKSARLGYDGKGQIRVGSRDDVVRAWTAMGGVPCVIERFVPLAAEVSVVVARTDEGETSTWPVAENRHRDGILDVSIVPARVPAALAAEARDIATAVAAKLDYRGVLCVEMFVTTEGGLVVNEIAPRPHNSGHYTIDACVTSQFEQQARVLAGLPLGDARQHEPAVMVNLLGDIWFAERGAAAREPEWADVLRHPRREAPSVWQGGAAARTQDGARDVPRPDARSRARDGARDQARPRDSGRRRAVIGEAALRRKRGSPRRRGRSRDCACST